MILNSSLGVAVRIINDHGGNVAFFAGDAVCALFGEEISANVIPVINALSEYFSQPLQTMFSPRGTKLQVRQVLAYGEIAWEIFPDPIQAEYLFSGAAIAEVDELSSAKEAILCAPAAAQKLGIRKFEKVGIGYKPKPFKGQILPVEAAPRSISNVSEHFLRQDLRGIEPVNEIRSAAICFMLFRHSEGEKQALPITILEKLAAQYGGYVNKLIPLGRDVAALVLFGIPQSKGKTLDRTAKFALEAVSMIPGTAVGISCGLVYAGFTCGGELAEYTAYGDPVNIASRLMDKAAAGMILTDSTFFLELHFRFQMQPWGKLPSRMTGKEISYYSLEKPAKALPGYRENTFVDRREELDCLKRIFTEAIATQESTIVYVSGDPGIGKTRLAKEMVARFKDQFTTYLIYCEEIIQSPLEGIKQILYQEFCYDPLAFKKSDLSAFRKAWKIFAGENESLAQHESVLASLLNLDWPGSFWSTLPSEAREMHLKNALLGFLQQLCATKQVCILLDDGQWLDEESRTVLKEFSLSHGRKSLIISPCRYLHDGSKVDLQLAQHRRYDLELDNLDQNGSQALIQEVLNIKRLPEDTVVKIHLRAMGNPLFIEQICYYLLENKLLGASGLILGSAEAMNTFRIHDIIGARIDCLDPQLQNTVLSAGVLGVEFSTVVLSHMLERDISSDLHEGIRLRLWKDDGKQIFAFTHVLIRDVAHQRLMGDKLRNMHQKAAEAFSAVYRDKVSAYAEEIALHYELAGMWKEAAHYYDLAGDDHWETSNFKRSEKNYHKALNLLDKNNFSNTPEYVEILFHLGLLYHYLLEHPTALTIYLEVLKFQEEYRGKENPGLSPYLNNLGRLYKDMEKYAESEVLLNRSLQIEIENMPTSSNVADRMNNLGHLYTMQNKHAKALPYYQKAVELMGANYSFHPYYGGFIKNLASTYLELGRLKDAEPLMAEGLRYTKKAYGDKHPAVAIQLMSQGRLYILQRKFKAAEKNYQQAFSIFNDVFGHTNKRTKGAMQALSELYGLMGKPRMAKSYRELLEKTTVKNT